jgi:Mg2+ and Co2+ transporter CorA
VPVTREEIEKRIDELTREFAETQDTKVKAELGVLSRRLAAMPHATVSIEEVFKELASDNYFNDQSAIPQPPKITEDQLKRCQDKCDFRPILLNGISLLGFWLFFFLN